MAEQALQAYYARDEERDRLAHGLGQVEFLRTTEICLLYTSDAADEL